MPVFFPTYDRSLNKINFCKKYNLDISKKIFTIFLRWPNYKKTKIFHQSSWLEKKIFDDKLLISNIVNILEKKKNNVILKPHPFIVMKFKPKFILGDKWETNNYDKITIISKEQMEPFINKYCFIEMEDSFPTNFFTDYGMIFMPSTISLQNYLYNYPLLHVGESKEIYEEEFIKVLKDKYNFENNCYGDFVEYETFKNNIENTITTFLSNYNEKNNQEKNNSLFDNTQINNDINCFSDYIEKVIVNNN